MKTARIKFSALTHMGNGQFTTAAGGIVSSLEMHSSLFSSPPVSTETLRQEIRKLSEMNATADGPSGSHNNRMERSLQRKVVYDMLVLNGQYVMGVANVRKNFEEQKSVIEMASYPAATGTRGNVERRPVNGLNAEVSTVPGIRKVKLKWKKGQASAFIVKGTQDSPESPQTVWLDLAMLTGNKCELQFTPGQWTVRVVGIYNSGHAEPGNSISFMMA